MWRKWIALATILGNIQMIVLLSIVYWVMVSMLALPLKLLSDPLGMRKSHGARWLKRPPQDHMIDSMKKQG